MAGVSLIDGHIDEPIKYQSILDVEDWLKQVKTLNELINSKIIEREQLLALATKITAGIDDMPHGSDITDKVGNIVVKLQALGEETDAAVDKYINLKNEVITAIEQLPLNEYKVLHRLYIRYMTITEIAQELNYSNKQISRTKKNGLKILKDVL